MLYIKEFFKNADSLRFFLLIFFLISPGIVYFFLWQPELFVRLNWIKLSLLSLSVMVPVAFINTIILLEFEKIKPSNHRRELVDGFVMTGAISGLFGSFVITATYLKSGNLFCNLILLEIFLAVVIAFYSWRDSRKSL